MDQAEQSKSKIGQLSWVSFPLKDDFPFSVIPIAFLILVAILAYTLFYHIMFAILAVLLLFSSLFKYFFPTRYTLDNTCIKIELLWSSKTHEWSKFKNFYIHKDGVHLSPFAKPSGLDPFRGIYVRKKTNIAELEEFLKNVINISPPASQS